MFSHTSRVLPRCSYASGVASRRKRALAIRVVAHGVLACFLRDRRLLFGGDNDCFLDKLLNIKKGSLRSEPEWVAGYGVMP